MVARITLLIAGMLALASPLTAQAEPSPACALGKVLIAELAHSATTAKVAVGEAPVTDEQDLKRFSPKQRRGVDRLMLSAWRSSRASNLLIACPELKSTLPKNFRVSKASEPVANFGFGDGVYFFGAPFFSKSGRQALVTAGVGCDGRCGGMTLFLYVRRGATWRRARPLDGAVG